MWSDTGVSGVVQIGVGSVRLCILKIILIMSPEKALK